MDYSMELTAMAPKRSSPEFTTLEASSVMDADLTGELADINITEPDFSGVVRPPS